MLEHQGYRVVEEIYHPEHMGSAATRLKSAHTGILAACDRGQVYFQLGPARVSQNYWFRLEVILAALHPEIHVQPILEAPPGSDDRLRLEVQIQYWAQLIFQYCEPLLAGDWSQLPTIKATERAVITEAWRQLRGEQ